MKPSKTILIAMMTKVYTCQAYNSILSFENTDAILFSNSTIIVLLFIYTHQFDSQKGIFHTAV